MHRLYSYKAEPRGTGCQAHADLGLLTVSPSASAPGLLVYDTERLHWWDVESSIEPCGAELTVFAGEQLSYLTRGAIQAALHRVPPPPAGTNRLSLPFFVRARHQAVLVPAKAPATAPAAKMAGKSHQRPRRVDDFVTNDLFRRRPWRPAPPEGSTPDF